jgi:hypothetical protein
MNAWVLIVGWIVAGGPVSATTLKNQTFTCVGTFTNKGLNPGYYQILALGDENDNPMFCLLDDDATKKVLAVCHEGDTCVVHARGESGNANGHLIQKVLSVHRK